MLMLHGLPFEFLLARWSQLIHLFWLHVAFLRGGGEKSGFYDNYVANQRVFFHNLRLIR